MGRLRANMAFTMGKSCARPRNRQTHLNPSTGEAKALSWSVNLGRLGLQITLYLPLLSPRHTSTYSWPMAAPKNTAASSYIAA